MIHPFPWLKAKVRHLTMLNYEIGTELLWPYVPRGVEIDLWEGKPFISIVGFMFRQLKIFGIPVPWCQEFEQANLRFYVRRRTEVGVRRGVVFVREVVPRRIVALVARQLFREKYVYLPMIHDIAFGEPTGSRHTRIEYKWYHHGRWHGIQTQVGNGTALPDLESLEAFCTERYWGYTVGLHGCCLEYRFKHPQWQIQPASAAAFVCGEANIFGPGFGACLIQKPRSAFTSEGSEIELFLPRALQREK
jgi:uncharacterized protein YqjF (DUF2071 family)